MPERSFLKDILRRIGGGRRKPSDQHDQADVVAQCATLIGEKSEAAGLVLATRILDQIEALDSEGVRDAFCRISEEFGVDDEKLGAAIDSWKPGDIAATRAVHFLAEPKSQELIRAFNRVPGATAKLVALRARLLEIDRGSDNLKSLDDDFRHLFASWFNRGFLELRRIDWSTPAEVLEKVIQYEAVHEIEGWDDLRQRVGEQDRRLFAYFHPAMPLEPLIFVEVALTKLIPSNISTILKRPRTILDPEEATVAVFYSISNCQKGLRGISFGNFLIKQVVSELEREFPRIATFVTLSPIPGLRIWADKRNNSASPSEQPTQVLQIPKANVGEPSGPDVKASLAAKYLFSAKRPDGSVLDPVAHFHLGNGATLHRINTAANLGDKAIAESWGVMINYLYDDAVIEANHRSYTSHQNISASAEVLSLLGED